MWVEHVITMCKFVLYPSFSLFSVFKWFFISDIGSVQVQIQGCVTVYTFYIRKAASLVQSLTKVREWWIKLPIKQSWNRHKILTDHVAEQCLHSHIYYCCWCWTTKNEQKQYFLNIYNLCVIEIWVYIIRKIKWLNVTLILKPALFYVYLRLTALYMQSASNSQK